MDLPEDSKPTGAVPAAKAAAAAAGVAEATAPSHSEPRRDEGALADSVTNEDLGSSQKDNEEVAKITDSIEQTTLNEKTTEEPTSPAAAASVAAKESSNEGATASEAEKSTSATQDFAAADNNNQKAATTTVPSTATTTKTPIQELWTLASAHAHKEIWGVTLADPAGHVPSQIVLQKYLNANDGDLAKAKEQLTKTLDWRAETKPLELIHKTYSKDKFGALGYVTVYEGGGEGREVFTWNIYGNVKSIETTFGDLDEFIRWRVALMEQAVQELNLDNATTPLGADPDADPYKMFQVHDYKGVSFLRQAPQVKAASTETIRVFATAYPELLKEKFFVNVPAVMGFMYGFIKLFVAARTAKKFHPMSNGGGLARENFGGSKVPLGDKLPTEYGGKGADLKSQGKEPLAE